jgi:hypothetical protein
MEHPSAAVTRDAVRPYHEMTLEEYTTTAHSQNVPRWSILAIPPESYSAEQLCKFGAEDLRALAFLWRVRQGGSKSGLAARIVRRSQFRDILARESESSLAKRPRKELLDLAREAGIYHSWLNRKEVAATLIQWRDESRRHAAREIAQTRHEEIVRTAARKHLFVPAENLTRYGLDRDGHLEPTILGMPLSRALQTAPEAIGAARTLTLPNFLEWVEEHPSLARRLVFIETGILGDGGRVFWWPVQVAFTPADLPPLFAPLRDAQGEFVSGFDERERE